MRYVWLVFAGLAVAMALLLPRLNGSSAPGKRALWAKSEPKDLPGASATSFTALRTAPAAPTGIADSIVTLGLAQRGTPYNYAGTSPLTGFDCSGFIMYTFAQFGVAVPHSTALLIDVGRPVARTEAQRGDIVVFTGTATTSTVPGHAGIVITRAGEVPLRFVHASSARREPGVKISQVEGTDYERRFMQVRRVLGPGTTPAKRVTANSAATVPALPIRPVALVPPALPETLRPRTLTTKKASLATAKRNATATKPAALKKGAPLAKRKASAKKPPAKRAKSTVQ